MLHEGRQRFFFPFKRGEKGRGDTDSPPPSIVDSSSSSPQICLKTARLPQPFFGEGKKKMDK